MLAALAPSLGQPVSVTKGRFLMLQGRGGRVVVVAMLATLAQIIEQAILVTIGRLLM